MSGIRQRWRALMKHGSTMVLFVFFVILVVTVTLVQVKQVQIMPSWYDRYTTPSMTQPTRQEDVLGTFSMNQASSSSSASSMSSSSVSSSVRLATTKVNDSLLVSSSAAAASSASQPPSTSVSGTAFNTTTGGGGGGTGGNVEGMSACLLILEDTMYLREWLAYHYTTLPLTSLIIALDPKNSPASQQRIQELTSRYSTLGLMNITLWYNDSYVAKPRIRNALQAYDTFLSTKREYKRSEQEQLLLPLGNATTTVLRPNKLVPAPPRPPKLPFPEKAHAERQCQFVTACLKHHQQQGRSWVLLTDTDEYLTFNDWHPDQEDMTHYDFHPKDPSFSDTLRQRNLPIRQKMLPFQRKMNRTIMQFLTQLQLQRKNHHHPPCYRIPGILYGPRTLVHNSDGMLENQTTITTTTSSSSSSSSSSYSFLPHPEQLATMSHLAHEVPRHGKFSKCLINVASIDKKKTKTNSSSTSTTLPLVSLSRAQCDTIHSAQAHLCHRNPGSVTRTSGADYPSSLLRLHHYKAHKAAFLERQLDSRGRRKEEHYQKNLNQIDATTHDDAITSWLNQFIQKVGIKTARWLLEQ
jgi:hypothetical protein